MVINQHHTNHMLTLLPNNASMMPAPAALAIIRVWLWNECNKIAIICRGLLSW
ncbi:hypothetical protein CKO_02816 [Citrobacter koseri ATCC BAA-895]|uniref:Uncharacterized protein n=1 Tax=Citrobacter koseri (strain ATCC BAA-895 / CDC 4225-83 / SGSC4696) TaxID=290338 RepID=A8AKA8_CITK8|nr:hypothetical protein CKO_02816 [Citrobacter koseri ATCC BAA-895]